MSDRSYKPISKADLRSLAKIAEVDRVDLFLRRKETGRLYAKRLFVVALCQGAALHFLDGKNGIKDFDVWSFYRANPKRPFPARRVGKVDFGNAKFGTAVGHPTFIGRCVDLIGRSIEAKDFSDPVAVLRDYLRTRRTMSAKCLSDKAMVIIHPPELLGQIVWPE